MDFGTKDLPSHSIHRSEMEKRTRKFSTIPVSFFGMAVGILAFAQTWIVAERCFQLSFHVSNFLTLIGLWIWSCLLILYVKKWITMTSLAIAEIQHPLQSSLAALGPISTLLASIAINHWSRTLGLMLFIPGMLWQLALGMWVYGHFWKGGRAPESISAAIYLPAVAQNLVAAMASAAFGWTEMGKLFFGAGFFSWLALESIMIQRAALQSPIVVNERPLSGIQMAPAVVAGVAYTTLYPQVADMFSMMLLGYGFYQGALLVRLLPWIAEQPFFPAYWSFSFGIAALSNLSLRLYERTQTNFMQMLSYSLLLLASIAISCLVGGTILLAWKKQLFPSQN